MDCPLKQPCIYTRKSATTVNYNRPEAISVQRRKPMAEPHHNRFLSSVYFTLHPCHSAPLPSLTM